MLEPTQAVLLPYPAFQREGYQNFFLFARYYLRFFFIIFFSFINVPQGSSDELDDIIKQINELTNALNMSISATKPLEDQVNSIKKRVAVIESDLTVKEKSINDGYKNLAKQQQILNATVRDFYIKSYYNSPLLILLSAGSASEFTQILGYQK